MNNLLVWAILGMALCNAVSSFKGNEKALRGGVPTYWMLVAVYWLTRAIESGR